jgi:transposase
MARRLARLLTDEQWAVIEPLLPAPKVRPDGRGRPWRSNRECFEGIVWVLKTGARWRDLPPPYPGGVTCWRRLKEWEEQGVWRSAWEALLGMLDERKRLQWEQAMIDATFRAAKKGATKSASRGTGRGRSARYS